MSTNAEICRELQLDVLLMGDESSDSFRAASRHVEACAACQQRLTGLAGDANWWSDAHSLLGADGGSRWVLDTSHMDRQLSSSSGGAADTVRESVLKLLETPSHPELLGRLGRYDVERVIGSGGMGVVLKAHDSELNRPIAVKLLAPHLAHVGAARERFAREGRAAAAVVHEHVVAIYNVEPAGPVPYLVMQYVAGRSLQARVDEDGPLSVEEMLRIGMQAAAGLAAAHRQGLVHRDVKPSNILLENQVERAVLTDFGLARAIDDASLTQTGILAGTPHYMSPEQATGGPIDHRSDLFSIGAVLYFMATGHPPFRATGTLAVLHRICREPHRPAWQFNKDLPDELCDVIDQLLEKKPGRRPASADEVQRQLAALLSRVQQRGLSRRRLRGWSGRALRRKAAWAAGIGSAAAVVFVASRWLPPAAEEPSVPVPPSGSQIASTPRVMTAVDEAAARQTERELSKGFGELRNALGAVAANSFYIRQGVDAWDRELQAVRNELARMEASR